MTTTTTTTPRACVVCLGCYGDGDLVGIWCDAEIADALTLADVHGGADRVRSSCEELWVMDHEWLPVGGEMSPHDTAEWARTILAVPEHLRGALCAWVRSGDYVAEGTGELPSTSAFEEAYCGTWASLRDYGEHLAEELGLITDDTPELLARFFDWDRWARDLEHDYDVVRADWLSVYIFRKGRSAHECREPCPSPRCRLQLVGGESRDDARRGGAARPRRAARCRRARDRHARPRRG